MPEKPDPKAKDGKDKEKDPKAKTPEGAVTTDRIVPLAIEDEMKTSYLNYAMSVIVGRALPDVRDGLKPVHRRILYAMRELGLENSRAYKKSARIVGEVLGKYHPHGDTAVYDTMVRMVQTFSLRYPLVDGQGNFGSVDGDSAAAMRYCVTGDTLVVTSKGLVPIRDLSPAGSEHVTLSVLSKDRAIHTASKWFDSGEHPTLKITTQRGFSLQGSYNHPVLTWAVNSETGRPEFRWKLLHQIEMGDVAVIDRTSNLLWPDSCVPLVLFHPRLAASSRVERKILPSELTEDLAYILGALVAEGTIREKEIEFCNSDAEWLKEFDERWERSFPDCRLHRFEREPSSYGKKPYFTREIHSRFCVDFLQNIGLSPVRSAFKAIPAPVLRSPKNVAASFLRAYFEGDGSISFSGRMTELSAVSTSAVLLDQIQVLLLRFGIASTRRFDRYREIHKLYIRGLENCDVFQKEIGFCSARKNEKLSRAICRNHKESSLTDFVPFISRFVRSHLDRTERWEPREQILKHNLDRYAGLEEHAPLAATIVEPDLRGDVLNLFQDLLWTKYLFDPIEKIHQCGIARVYSIRVDSECHSFVANGFINHNTEARLAPIATHILSDIDKETVDFAPNFDETLEEPKLLPASLPNLLVNGSSGIAVGMATNIPPHNLREVIDAILALIDDPNLTIKDLQKFIKGPDFPTGANIVGTGGIKSAYETGRGLLRIRAKASIEEQKGGREAIIVTEIPYQVNKSTLIETIADLVNDKKIEGIADVRDESDRTGMRIVVILKRDAAAQVVLNQLYKHTQMQSTFGVILLALADGRPKVMNLKTILEHYIRHRKEIIIRRSRFELEKAKDRAHILEGLKVALDNLDRIIKTIRQSKTPAIAKEALMTNFDLSDRQAQAILEMQLQRLTGLEREKIDEEYRGVLKRIDELETILRSEKKVLEIIKAEALEIKEKFGDDRRTQITRDESSLDMSMEDLIADEDVVVTISHQGYVKRSPIDSYRKQRRGGVGIIGGQVTESENGEQADFVEHLFVASTHDHLLLFTSKGKAYAIRVHELPQATRTAKGKFIKNFVSLNQGETVNSYVPIRQFEPEKSLVMVTKMGVIKKTDLSQFDNIRKSGIVAINLHKSDELISVRLAGGKDNIFVATRQGKAIHFPEKGVRAMGRAAAGVRGINLRKNDYAIGMEVVDKNDTLLTVTEKGFAKRTKASEYRLQSRGGKGITNISITQKNGAAIGMRGVSDADDLMVMSQKGMVVRVPVKDIRQTGRAAQGVRVINLKPGDHAVTMTCIEAEESLAEAKPSPAAA